MSLRMFICQYYLDVTWGDTRLTPAACPHTKSMILTCRAWPTWPTSSTTSGSPVTTAPWRRTSLPHSPSWRACSPPTTGPAPSTRAPSSPRSTGWRITAASPTPRASPVWSRRHPLCRRSHARPSQRRNSARTALRMVRRKPLPFPPEPLASLSANAVRWSLDCADHITDGATCCCAPWMSWGWASDS